MKIVLFIVLCWSWHMCCDNIIVVYSYYNDWDGARIIKIKESFFNNKNLKSNNYKK